MQFWLEVFCIIAAIALVIQVVILTLLFFELKRSSESTNRLVTDLQSRVGPILTRVQILLDDRQAKKIDRVVTDAADRLRGQLVHADRILTGTLEAVEDAGAKFSHSFWRPVQKASALVQGIKVGLDLLRSRRGRSKGDEPREQQEEELFI